MQSDDSPPTVVELVSRIRRGDPSAEDVFARRYGTRMRVMALARTRDPSAAEDLAQDAMINCLQALRRGQLEFPERLAAFVHGTMRNVLNHYFRGRDREPDEVPLSDQVVQASILDQVERDERLALVSEILERLGTTDAAILRMSLIEGLGPSEIAGLLQLSPDVVRARKSRSIKKAIDMLHGTSGDPGAKSAGFRDPVSGDLRPRSAPVRAAGWPQRSPPSCSPGASRFPANRGPYRGRPQPRSACP
jgi:RNA polymerase sigma-70 factor (ECF subfamily)